MRSVRWLYDDDGCLVIRATLPPERGALVIEALQAVLDRLEEEIDDPNEAVQVEQGHPHGTCRAVDEAAEETGHDPVHEAVRDEREDVSPETCNMPSAGPNPNSYPNSNPNLNPYPDPNPGQDSNQNPTLSQRRADALVFLSDSWLAGNASGPGTGDAQLVKVHIDSSTLAPAVAGRSELAEGPGLASETVRRLSLAGRADGLRHRRLAVDAGCAQRGVGRPSTPRGIDRSADRSFRLAGLPLATRTGKTCSRILGGTRAPD